MLMETVRFQAIRRATCGVPLLRHATIATSLCYSRVVHKHDARGSHVQYLCATP